MNQLSSQEVALIVTTAYKTMYSSLLPSSKLSVVAEGENENEEFSSSIGTSGQWASRQSRQSLQTEDDGAEQPQLGVIVEADENETSRYDHSARKLVRGSTAAILKRDTNSLVELYEMNGTDFGMTSKQASAVWTCVEQLEKFGVLGPCSYDKCQNQATKRCSWTLACTLQEGGCDESYCLVHAYQPLGTRLPLCCDECAPFYKSDMRLSKLVRIVAAFILIICCAIGTVFGFLNRSRDLIAKPFEYSAWERSDGEKSEVDQRSKLIDTATGFDHKAQSLAIGLALLQPLNQVRVRNDRHPLKWQEHWFNAAFEVAQSFALGKDVRTRSEEEQLYLALGQQMQIIDLEITLVETSAFSQTPLDDALSALLEEDRAYGGVKTHTAIAAFQRLDTVYFAQLSAYKVDGQSLKASTQNSEQTDQTESVLYGQKALHILNRQRASYATHQLEWSDRLHQVAYRQVRIKTATGAKTDQLDTVLGLVQQIWGDVTSLAVRVAAIKTDSLSKAVEDAVKEWAPNQTMDGGSGELGGDFTYAAIGAKYDSKADFVHLMLLLAETESF